MKRIIAKQDIGQLNKASVQAGVSLRPDQEKAYLAIQPKRRAIVNMPTGWGKSVLLSALTARDILDGRKVVISVPQRMIAKNFIKQRTYRLPTGEQVAIRMLNLCDATESKVAGLVDYLQGDANYPVVTTHVTLALAAKRLGDGIIAEVAANTTFIIDESHHVQASGEANNMLGRFVRSVLSANDQSIRILFATAYYFRGDGTAILSDADYASFYHHSIPFDEYWQSLKHLKTYEYDFIIYKGDPFEEVNALLKRSKMPTIVYCPPEGHAALAGLSKTSYARRILRGLVKAYGATLWSSEANSDDTYIVDLVSLDNRIEKINFIAKHPERVAAVATVGMFKEGADWPAAARVIDLVPSGSDQDRLQRFGRLCRDFPGKKHVSYHNCFPYVLGLENEERRLELSKLYAHFHASLVLENVIRPVVVPATGHASTDPNHREACEKAVNVLGQLSPEVQHEVLRNTCDALIHCEKLSSIEIKRCIINTLHESGICHDQEALAMQLMLLLRRRSGRKFDATALIQAGFDKIWNIEAADGLVRFSGDIGGPRTFAEIRSLTATVFEQEWFRNFRSLDGGPPKVGCSLYYWCTHQKVVHGQGKLSHEKVELLEALPWWSWQNGTENRWQQQYRSISVLPNCPRSGTKEYDWVRSQRRLRVEGALPQERAWSLESIPWWSWNDNATQWERNLALVRTLPCRPRLFTKEYELVRYYQKRKKAGKLSAERIVALEAISWWKW